MRQFNTPPGWPEPPNARWRPPKYWSPEESWPEAPLDWPFWVDGDGRRVRGPLGRYGGPSLVPIVGSVGVLVALCGVVLFLYFGLLGGRDTPQAGESPAGTETFLPPPPTVPLPSPGETPTLTPSPSPHSATPSPVQTPSTVPPSTPPTTPPTTPPSTPATVPTTRPPSTPTPPAAVPVYYKNCPAVRRAGLLVLLRGQPGYSARLDPDGDGIACDRRSN